MAKGYWIARITVREPERYPEYIAIAQPAYKRYNAKFVVRGGQLTAAEGTSHPRNVVIEFASYQDALDCYNSPEYTEAKKIRQAIADGDLIIIEGFDG
jgi:uncharacterized protein (DUF1330 family)